MNKQDCKYHMSVIGLRRKRRRRFLSLTGFTLIEILAVISIIIILIGLLSPALNKAQEQAKIEKARAIIGSIEVALSMYYTDYGAYPAEVAGSNNFVNTLGTKHGFYGPYVEFKTKEKSVDVALDPWSKAYRYDKTSPPHNTGSFDLYSYGPDGADDSGGDDDITNW